MDSTRNLLDRLACSLLALLARVVKPKRGRETKRPTAGDVMRPVSRLYP